MTKRKTSIQINGKHYDALTGALLSFEETSAPAPVRHTTKSIDGVIGGHSALQPTAPRPHHASKTPATAKAVKAPVKLHPVAPHAKARQAKPSAALMRHAVKKPATAPLKRYTKVQTPTHRTSHIAATSKVVVVPKTSLHSVNHQRAVRASQVSTSPRIAHFAHQLSMSVTANIEQTVSAIDRAIVVPKTAPAPRHYQPDIRRVAPVRPRPTSDVFEQALLRATSHQEPAPAITAPKRRAFRSLRRRMVSFGAGAVAVLAIVGVFGYHGDAIQFKVATSRAGFSATMPGYQPRGYSMTSVQTSSGRVQLKYVSPTTIDGNSRSFAVTEKPSNWNSETLLENITASKNTSTYSTIKKAGRTIYVYGKNQAAWVHNGILYQVLGNGALSTQEFVAIATSM